MSFVPEHTVEFFEPEDDGYNYNHHFLDQERFNKRIEKFEAVLKPFLTVEHRKVVMQRNNAQCS